MKTLEDRLHTYGETLDGLSAPDLLDRTTEVVGTPIHAALNQRRRSRNRSLVFGFASLLLFALAVANVVLPSGSNSNGATAQGRHYPEGTEWVFPVDEPSTFVDTFGADRMVGTKYVHKHQGIDIFARKGTPVRAIRAGKVSKKGVTELGGNRLWLTDANGNNYYYAHLDSFVKTLSNGDKVLAGEVLGYVGTTGQAAGTPPHLHFEIHENGAPINPTPIMAALAVASPPQLVVVNGITVSTEIAEPLRKLLDAAEKSGHKLSGGGYRSPTHQLALRMKNCGSTPSAVFLSDASSCKRPTARPGVSFHERGTAVDFTINGRALTKDQPATKWLFANAARFGFQTVLNEPWHWELKTPSS